MHLDILMKIKENPTELRFLREHSYWYKYLNRDSKYYKEFIDDMKKIYKLTTTDKINKVLTDINTLKNLLDVLK